MTAARSGLLGFVDRVGFQRWAATLLVVQLVGIVALFLRDESRPFAVFDILQIAVAPPLWAALVWSLRTRLGLPDPWVIPMTVIGVIGAVLDAVRGLISAVGGTVAPLLPLAVLMCNGSWLFAFGVGSHRSRTFIDQSPTLATIAGIGLIAWAAADLLFTGALLDAVEQVAAIFVLAQYVWLFRVARTAPTPAPSWA